MRAIVLAGGAGTRLRHVLGDTPKPMAPVCGRPFLTYILDNLIGHGCRRVWLSVGVGQEVVIDYFGSAYGSLPIEYVIEDAPLGTGGALARAIAAVDEFPVFALNGDTFSDLDYQEMLEVCCQQANTDTLALYDAANPIALETLVNEHGVQLRTFSNEILEAAWNETQAYQEEQAADNADFSRILDSFKSFREQSFPYFGGNELKFANFAFPKIQSSLSVGQ